MTTIPTEHLCAYLLAPEIIELRTVPTPRPARGQVLLRLECALAGGTDRKAFARGHPQIPMPGPFGYRYAGVIAALGEGVTGFEVGQPVMGVHSAPCLRCELCRKERWHLCPHVMKEKVLGAFGQYLCLPAPIVRQNLYPRPISLSAEQASLLEPLACVVHALELIDWHGVERVLVLGLGSVGLLFAQLLPHYTKVVATGAGRRAVRVELARLFGLDPVWNVEDRPVPDREQFDCVIECTGRLEGWQQAFAHTAPGGQTLLFGGIPKGVVFPVDSYRLHYEEVRVLGSFHFSPRDVARARDFLLAGTLQLDPLITARGPLSRITEALQSLQRGEALQYVIDVAE
jgi:L-iditol 2-dehydrogenase